MQTETQDAGWSLAPAIVKTKDEIEQRLKCRSCSFKTHLWSEIEDHWLNFHGKVVEVDADEG